MTSEKQTGYSFVGGKSFLLSEGKVDGCLLKSDPIVSMGKYKGKIVAAIPIAMYTPKATVSDWDINTCATKGVIIPPILIKVLANPNATDLTSVG